MNKYTLISFLQEAQASRVSLLEFGQVLIDGVNLERAEEPAKCIDTDFMTWFDGQHELIHTMSWYKDLKMVHRQYLQAYKDLYVETMRMYNPKTLEELLEHYSQLEYESNNLRRILDEIEVDIRGLSDQEYEKLGLDDEKEGTIEFTEESNYVEENNHEAEIVESNDNDDELQMETIDIEKDDIDVIDSTTDEDEDNEPDELEVKNASEEQDYESENEEKSSINTRTSLLGNIQNNVQSEAIISQHISLKEQDIKQLEQEKELTELELTHLEERHKLTEQSVEQLEHYYNLKQEEVETEQQDNERLLEFKIQEWKTANNEIAEFDTKKHKLDKTIEDLETEHQKLLDDQKLDEKTESLTKQFDELKKNKTNSLLKTQDELSVRQDDLESLKEQVIALEDEITSMQQEIEKKELEMTGMKT